MRIFSLFIVFVFATTSFSQTFMRVHHTGGVDCYDAASLDSVVFVNCDKKVKNDFKGKRILFCGDSVTKGYVNGTEIVENSFPKLFAEAVGATFTNSGVGGATISQSEHGSIKEQIVKGADKNYDFLFVAGGINDWQLGVQLSDFKKAVEDICDYININYPVSTKVIFITPINHGGWDTTHSLHVVAEVQDYRNVIEKVVEGKNKGNFIVVRGESLGFPSFRDKGDVKDLFFGDKLHPSKYGYMMYAVNLIKALM